MFINGYTCVLIVNMYVPECLLMLSVYRCWSASVCTCMWHMRSYLECNVLVMFLIVCFRACVCVCGFMKANI